MARDFHLDLYHVPLSQERREIRLLGIDKLEGDILNCSLRTVCLHDNPQFQALSYTWGDVNVVKPVRVNGVLVDVTSNLETALQALRRDPAASSIWVDALCINQADMEEKNYQVPLMREIFRTAQRIIAWVGQGDRTSAAFIETLKMLTATEANSPLTPQFLGHVARAHILASSVLAQPYWQRIWVVQELALGLRDTVVRCGYEDTSIELNEFLSGVDIVWTNLKNLDPESNLWIYARKQCIEQGHRSMSLDDDSPGLLSEEERLFYLRVISCHFIRHLVRSQNVGIGSCLTLTSERLATNPADRVYALLGLLSPEDRANIVVDYRTHHMAAFHEYIAACWESKNSHAVSSIVDCDFDRNKPCVGSYPSWVPDLCHQPQGFGFDSNLGGPVWSRGARSRLSHDKQYVVIGGLPLDRVQLAYIEISDMLSLYHPATCLSDPSILSVFSFVYRWARDSFDQAVDEGRHLLHFKPHQKSQVGIWKHMLGGAPLHLPKGLHEDDFEKFWVHLFQDDHPEHRVESYLASIEVEMRALLIRAFRRFYTYARDMLQNKSMFCTEAGFMGISPKATICGDQVVLLHGCHIPVVLREEPGGYHTIVGSAHMADLVDLDMLTTYFDEGRLQSKLYKIR